MTTADIRAVLRDAADALKSEAYNKRQTMYAELFGDHLPSRYDEIAARLVALADAPPTVAELLPRVDEHAAYWTAGGVEWRAVHDVGAGPRVLFQAHDLREGRWITMHTIEDFFSAPARHAAVTPVTP